MCDICAVFKIIPKQVFCCDFETSGFVAVISFKLYVQMRNIVMKLYCLLYFLGFHERAKGT